VDTKYFAEALAEFGREQSTNRDIGKLKVAELSHILRRAQELKDAEKLKDATLDRTGV